MISPNRILLGGALLALSAITSFGQMALVDYDLPGNEQSNVWNSLTAASYPGYGGFPGSGAWPGPMASQVATGGGDATLNKISNGTGGGPYPASGSMYYGGFSGDINNDGGTLAVVDNSPIANLSNIVFQIQIGEAWTYDFLDHELPTLTYTTGLGTVVGLAASNSSILEKFYNGTVEMPTGEEDIYINTYALQWDLSGVTEPITSFSISFTGVQHAQLYKLSVEQSDTYVQAVPEPTSAVLFAAGAVVALSRCRRRSA